MTVSDTGISRRDLLTAAVAATASMALAKDGQSMDGTKNGMPRVAVVGGGFGGLACAYELSASGYWVDLFEARNRLGGRVRSVQEFAPSQHVEFGAELIGKNHPHWLRYAGQFGDGRVRADGCRGGCRLRLQQGRRGDDRDESECSHEVECYRGAGATATAA